MRSRDRRIPALLRRGGRSPVVGGGGGPPAPVQVWDDLTALAGYTFSRSTVATDGHSAIDPTDVDSYAINALREISAKLGLSYPAYLLEGSRTNLLVKSNDWGTTWPVTGTVTVTTGQSDPSGGTDAARIASASGNNYILQSISSPPAADATHTVFVRQGPGTGAWQVTNTNPTTARGGTAGAAWTRQAWPVTLTGGTVQWRVGDGSDRSGVGGVVAGARDFVVFGAQTEVGVFGSTYIPGTGGAATPREYDDLTVTLPAAWCADVLTVEYRPLHSSAQHVTSATTRRLIDDGTHRLSLVVDGGASKVQLVTTGGTYLSPALTYSAGDTVRIEVDWSALELDVSVNATPVTTTSITGAWVSGGTAQIGSTSANTENAFGSISIGGIR